MERERTERKKTDELNQLPLSMCDQNIEGTVICLEEVEISTQARRRESDETDTENALEESGVEKQNRKRNTLHPKMRKDRAGSGQCAGSK